MKAKTKTPCQGNNQEAEYLPDKSDHTVGKTDDEEPNAEKANNATTKKKPCHNMHTNQILRPAVDASAA